MAFENCSISEALHEILVGEVGFLGIGNTDRTDDGAGVILARRLMECNIARVFESGTMPERFVSSLRNGGYDTVVFLDAVDAGLEPGTVIILNAQEMQGRFPQVSTHKMSLSTLAGLVAEGTTCTIWLIGIQPRTIEMGNAMLSETVDSSVYLLAGWIAEAMQEPMRTSREQLCN